MQFDKCYQEPKPERYAAPGYSTGGAYGDFDDDGDLDLVVANKDTFSLFYINPTNNDSYVRFRIHGIKSNRDGIGTRIKIFAAGHLLGRRDIFGGGGYLSFNEPLWK